ncbi:MAG: Trk system potassium transporter TrkA [Butyricicoccus sp.]
MKIIIVGCGKVGLTLAKQLQAEGIDLVLVDTNLSRLNSIPDDLDAIRLHGNGSSIQTLRDADVEHADLLLAVTTSDELNLLCCVIAKRVSQCHTIARVRNPLYTAELGFIKEKLGISMIINPELAAAMEIARLLCFPSAIKIDTFAKNRIELLKFRLRPEFGLDGIPISQIGPKTRSDILICGVERGSEVFIPDGNFTLNDNDILSIIASTPNAAMFFRSIGLKTDQVRSVLIVGGGKIAFYLARRLLRMKMDVRIIEKKWERCQELSELLPAATIICGDGTDRQLLLEEGLAETEAFVALTDMDEENILLTLYAQSISRAKLVTKVNRIDFNDIIDRLDIGSVIYPKYMAADYILQYVRAMYNSLDSNVETLYQILDNRAEALEFSIREASEITGVPLCDLQLKPNILIGSINRRGKVLIPRGQDCIEVGDTVVVITSQKGLRNIKDILRKPKRTS